MLQLGDQHVFDGFCAEDFDAYLPEKWNSNMFTLPRRAVKGKLEAIGKELSDELKEFGLTLVMRLSDEFPSLLNKKQVDTQWLFFSRDEAAQAELSEVIDKERSLAATLADPTPRYRQVFLGVAIDKGHLEIGLRVHHDAWVDRKNLLNVLAADEGRERFAQVLQELPAHYTVRVGDSNFESPSIYDAGQVKNLADAFESSREWLFIGARLPRDQVAVLGAEVTETAKEAFRDLSAVYRAIAWSPENDAVSMDQLVAQHNEELRASHEQFDKERSEREARRVEEKAKSNAFRMEIEEKVRETDAWRQREFAARRAAAARAHADHESEARSKAEALAAKLGLGGPKTDESQVAQPAQSEVVSADETPRGESAGDPLARQDRPDQQGRQQQGRPDQQGRQQQGRPDQQGRQQQGRQQQGRPDQQGRQQARQDRPERQPRRFDQDNRDRRPSQGHRDQRPQRDSAKQRDESRALRPVAGVSQERASDIRVGDLVEVNDGFLRGRRGVVQALEEKGDLRVAFGSLSSRLGADEVKGLGPAAPGGQPRSGRSDHR